MDPITHTLLGAAIGEGFFRRCLGNKAVLVSAVAANLPDIDTIVLLSGDPGSVILRRSFGHSLFLLPLWIAGLTWLFKRRYDELETRALALAITVNCMGHLFFDLINSFGVQLFWPFSSARPELAFIFIVDFTLAGFLAAPHLARLKASWRPALPALSRAALVSAAFYLALAFSAREYAMFLLARETGGGGFQYAFPEPLGASRWRGVVKDGDFWRVSLIDSSQSTVTQHHILPNDEARPEARAARRTRFGERLDTFFMAPVWTVDFKRGGGAVASVYDLRFMSLRFPRSNAFEYAFDVEKDGAKPRRVRIW